jgi:hypothetical protein
MTEQEQNPQGAQGAPGGRVDVLMKVMLGLALGAIPFALIVVVRAAGSWGGDSLVERLPDPEAKARLMAKGPSIVPLLVGKVYKCEKPGPRELAMMDVIAEMDHIDQLPIFVRRAYFAEQIRLEAAEKRLYGVRGLANVGPPYPMETLDGLGALLDDTRAATVEAAPGAPLAVRKGLGQAEGIVAEEAADFLGATLSVVLEDPGSGARVTPETPTAKLSPEMRKLRVEKIREAIARAKAGLKPPPGPPAPTGEGRAEPQGRGGSFYAARAASVWI